MVAAPVVVAQEPLTKRQIINRSGEICANAVDAVTPHVRRMQRAQRREELRRFIRHGRRVIDTARPYVRRLDKLSPPSDGRTRYRRFVDNTDEALDLLDASLDALADRRGRLAVRRAEAAVEHTNRAERAARRFGLRESCILFVS